MVYHCDDFLSIERRKRSVVCRDFPSKCKNVTDEVLCRDYSIYCPPKDIFERHYEVYTGHLICSTDCYSWKKTMENEDEPISITLVKMLTTTEYSEDEELEPVKVPFTTKQGEPAACYAFATYLNRHKSKLINETTTKNLRLFIDQSFLPDELLNPKAEMSFSISIHDYRYLVNPFKNGFTMKGGTTYLVNVNGMTIRELLPPPYDSNCTDYETAWMKNNKTGPLTQKNCIEECIFQMLKREGKCIPKTLDYSHMEELCEGRPDISQNHEVCSDQCTPACLQKSYNLDIRKNKFRGSFSEDELEKFRYWMDAGFMSLDMSIYGNEVTTFKHRPKIMTIEVFSNLGGYMGSWIGLSFLSYLDIAESLWYTAFYYAKFFYWSRSIAKKNVFHTKLQKF